MKKADEIIELCRLVYCHNDIGFQHIDSRMFNEAWGLVARNFRSNDLSIYKLELDRREKIVFIQSFINTIGTCSRELVETKRVRSHIINRVLRSFGVQV